MGYFLYSPFPYCRLMVSRKVLVPVVALALCALVLVYLLFDPAQTAWMPKCMVHTLTGFSCPGCGSQRAVHALLHGDVGAAFRANALLVIMIVPLVFAGYVELNRRRFPVLYRRMSSPAVIAVLLVVIVGWGVVRNFIAC